MTSQELLTLSTFFNSARKEMLKVKFRSRIGSALVYKNRVINKGHNKPNKTSPMMKKYHEHKTTHAEIDALTGAYIPPEKLSRCVLYLYRETKDGQLAMAKPCQYCFEILKEHGIKKVFYTTDNGFEEMVI